MKCEFGLNPNNTQIASQRKWESDYIKVKGKCHACIQEEEENMKEIKLGDYVEVSCSGKVSGLRQNALGETIYEIWDKEIGNHCFVRIEALINKNKD